MNKSLKWNVLKSLNLNKTLLWNDLQSIQLYRTILWNTEGIGFFVPYGVVLYIRDGLEIPLVIKLKDEKDLIIEELI